MAENEKPKFVPFTTEERKAFGKQFTPKEKASYYHGKRQAYSHMSNTARRESVFVSENLKNGNSVKGDAKGGKGKPRANKDDLPF
jgi:hypothetical protein